ncbi:hypothetical protein GCM10010517_69210 [Streptosporangium fragile]|uniref:SnoaL-like domain-containing protein n=1 Tax=Streptosporangium fragile TaxID=46186 RepID=A0ABN3W7W7_9ACTN
MTESTTPAIPGPHEIFERMRQQWLGLIPDSWEDLADDVIVEVPFAPPGRRRRFEGREDFLSFAVPGRAAFPVRFDEVRNIVIHDTGNPEVIVVEYELSGTVTTTGRQASAPFIAILGVRNGKTILWREYQNPMAIAEALEPMN